MNLNRAQIIGNLTRDVELRKTPGGQDVATFGIATSRKWKDQQSGENREQTEFHNIVAWGKLATICQQYLGKGRKVFVEGRLQTREWEKDGVKRQRTEIIAEDMIMLDRAPEGAARAPQRNDEGRDDAGYAAAHQLPAASASQRFAPPPPVSTESVPVESQDW